MSEKAKDFVKHINEKEKNSHVSPLNYDRLIYLMQAYADQELMSYIKRIVSHINNELEQVEGMINEGGIGQKYWINKKGSWNEFLELIVNEHPRIYPSDINITPRNVFNIYQEWAGKPENKAFGFNTINNSHIMALSEFISEKLLSND